MSLRELLFPRKCPFCQQLQGPEEPQPCSRCAAELPWTRESERGLGSFFSVTVAPLHYGGKAREALLRYKFGRRKAYADCFASLMARCVEQRLAGRYEAVTWVPLSWQRQRKRGFSQSKLLAELLAGELGVPCIPTLRKARNIPAQSHLWDAAARRANVSGAFRLRKGAAVEGRYLLLVDDVFTTGATLAECSRILLTAGAERVVCATVCMAAKPDQSN